MEQLGDTTDDTAAAAPPPTAPAAPSDRVIGGVAGVIAARLGLDALWVRLGFVVLGLAGGIGVVLYGAWWLVLIGGSWSRPLRWLGGAALLAVVPLLVANGPDSFVTGPVAVVLLLAGLALALWQPRRDLAAPAFVGFPPPTIGDPAGGRSAPGPHPGTTPGGDDPLWQAVTSEEHAPQRSRSRRLGAWPRRERSVLGRLTLGIAVLAGAGWALADQLDGGRLHPEQWFGTAAVVCGAGLLVGALRGRARWLIVPAVLAAGAGYMGGTMARLGIPMGDLGGDRYVSVGDWTGRTEYSERVGIGQINISVDPTLAAASHVDARVGMGSIHLNVPADATVEVRPRLDHGTIVVSGRPAIDHTPPTLTIGDAATPDVVVDAWIGRGDLHITVYDMGPYLPAVPDPPATTAPGMADVVIPDEAGALVPVGEGLAMTTDGWVVLGNGDALISPTDEVTVANAGQYPPDAYPGHPDGSLGAGTLIDTGWGQYRLLPRSLLVTPDGQVVDLQDLRTQVAAATAVAGRPTTNGAPASTTAEPDGATTTTVAVGSDAPVPTAHADDGAATTTLAAGPLPTAPPATVPEGVTTTLATPNATMPDTTTPGG